LRPRALVTQPIAASALERLRRIADVRINDDATHIPSPAEIAEGIGDCEALFCLLHDTIDARVIEAGAKLRIIASMKITPSAVDLAAATARRLPVTVIPPMVGEATADLHMGLLLAVARRILEGDRAVRSGLFPGGQSRHFEGAGVHGKTIGLIGGGGRIGRAVAKRAQGFSMRCLYWGPRRKAESDEREWGITFVPLETLLQESDFVSVHAPLTAETRHLVGARELGLMKRSAFIVNTARGPILDEDALVRALAEGRIAGAGLDVFEREPHVAQALLAMPNVVLTPHLGSAVADLRESMAHVVVDNIEAVLEGRRPPNCWNTEIYGSPSAGGTP
jgi:glyoxylate reductase